MLELLALILFIVGVSMTFKLRGKAARTARKWYAIGLVLFLGGCFGSVASLSGETTGNSNFASVINPFIWVGLLLVGVLVLLINSVNVIRARERQKQSPVDVESGSDGSDGSREF
ncbi:MAG: hypothetical protein ACE37N_11695 [Pseudohongiellaceae bacterium]